MPRWVWVCTILLLLVLLARFIRWLARGRLVCKNCGAQQRVGDYDAAMKRKWKALGKKWVRIPPVFKGESDQQCLACGSMRLVSVRSAPTQNDSPYEDAARSIVAKMLPYFQDTARLTDEQMEEIKGIGWQLDKQGGIIAMRKVFYIVRDEVIRRKFPRSADGLDALWKGVGDWY